MSVLVTGASGLAGYNLVHTLIFNGEKVRVLLRNNDPGNGFLRDLPLDRSYGEVTSLNALRQAMRDCRAVYHMEEKNPFAYCPPQHYEQVNVRGTENVLRAAKERGVTRVVHLSSAFTVGTGTYRSPASESTPFNLADLDDPYVHSKREAESLAADYLQRGLEIVLVNPGLLLGPGAVYPTLGLALIRFSGFIARFVPEGGTLITDTQDLARVSLLAMKNGTPGQRYLAGSENLKYRAFLDLLDSVVGIEPYSMLLPRPLAMLAARAGEAYARISGTPLSFMPSVSTVKRTYLDLACSPEIATFKFNISWTPVHQTIEKALQWRLKYGLT